MVSLDVCWYFERTGRIAGLVLHEVRLRDKEGDHRWKEKRKGEEKALMWLKRVWRPSYFRGFNEFATLH